MRFGLARSYLLVVVDPPGVVPIFVALTKDETPTRRRAILIRAVLIAFGVAIFFLLAGRSVLSYLGVTVHAFAISGGILLFATAMPMLFGQRGGLQAPEEKERGSVGQDISVFPLAIRCFRHGWTQTTTIVTSEGRASRAADGRHALRCVYPLLFRSSWRALIARLGKAEFNIARE